MKEYWEKTKLLPCKSVPSAVRDSQGIALFKAGGLMK
ncbi:hypothetical protein U722_19265 [Bacillus amyloliquefaciens LFB112]|nr:hypothetical protein U722_19265 [Bacillus amyloliquefaciens LFB112]